MDNAPLILSSTIRTSASDTLLNTISLKEMQDKLFDLFIDRENKKTVVNLLETNAMKESLRYIHCRQLNDELTIDYNQKWKQSNDIFDEKRQIWIDKYIDAEKDDMFIPRDDAL